MDARPAAGQNGAMDALATFVRAHLALAGPVFGLLALGENTAGVGALIPATPLLFLFGTLVGSGEVTALAIVPWAVAGTIVGAAVSFELGRALGPRVLRTPRLRRWRRGLARLRRFFARYGPASLIVGRFVLGPFQAMLPTVAGAARMPRARFLGWTVVGAVVWVAVVLAPGWLAGRGLVLVLPPGERRVAVALFAAATAGATVVALAAGAWRLRRGRA